MIHHPTSIVHPLVYYYHLDSTLYMIHHPTSIVHPLVYYYHLDSTLYMIHHPTSIVHPLVYYYHLDSTLYMIRHPTSIVHPPCLLLPPRQYVVYDSPSYLHSPPSCLLLPPRQDLVYNLHSYHHHPLPCALLPFFNSTPRFLSKLLPVLSLQHKIYMDIASCLLAMPLPTFLLEHIYESASVCMRNMLISMDRCTGPWNIVIFHSEKDKHCMHLEVKYIGIKCILWLLRCKI